MKRFPVCIKFALEPFFTFLLCNDSIKLFMLVNHLHQNDAADFSEMMDGRMDGFTIGYWCCHCFQDCSIPKKAKKEIICYQSDGAKVVHPLLKLLDYPSKIILMYFKIYLLHE